MVTRRVACRPSLRRRISAAIRGLTLGRPAPPKAEPPSARRVTIKKTNAARRRGFARARNLPQKQAYLASGGERSETL
jgi:hypothetical protein